MTGATTRLPVWLVPSTPCWTGWSPRRSSNRSSVSNASHELRSPLTTLLATVERAVNDQSNTDWSEVSDTIMREGRRLDVIIDGLFWLARHDENQIEVEQVDVDLDDLLFEESQRVRSMSELNVDTAAVQPTRVLGDPAMLKRMIRNVVDNAVRYATRELRFSSAYDGTFAVVTVGDDGVGVDVSQSARLLSVSCARTLRGVARRAALDLDSRSSPRSSRDMAVRAVCFG